MNRLRVIIADDERPAREYLKKLLAAFDEVELVAEADNGTRALELIRALKPDLALLDLQMPELSGVEVASSIEHDKLPLIAFVTAYNQHAVKAFELNAVDYLLKPVERSRLQETIRRASERVETADRKERDTERHENAAYEHTRAAAGSFLDRLPVKKRDEILLIPTCEVVSIVADGELLIITTGENHRYTINYRLKDLEQRLDPKRFVRLSRGALANLDFVDRVTPMPGGTYLINLTNGQEISASRVRSKFLRSELLKL